MGKYSLALILYLIAPRLISAFQVGGIFDEIISILVTPEIIAVLLLIGVSHHSARFFSQQLWPWYVEHVKRQRETEREIRLQRMINEQRNNEKMQELVERLIVSYTEIKEEIVSMTMHIDGVIRTLDKR